MIDVKRIKKTAWFIGVTALLVVCSRVEANASDFVHFASVPGNTSGSVTYLDHAELNGNPEAILLVTQNFDRSVFNNHNTAVWYNIYSGKWAVLNQDGAPMPNDAGFTVYSLPIGGRGFTHIAAATNTVGNVTFLENPLTDGHPEAKVFVTSKVIPGFLGYGGVYNNNPIGVWYDWGRAQWAVFNQITSPLFCWAGCSNIPIGAAFNVVVTEPWEGSITHIATSADTGGNFTLISEAPAGFFGRPLAVTASFNPNGVYCNFALGLNTSVRAILTEGFQPMPLGAAFNILLPPPPG